MLQGVASAISVGSRAAIPWLIGFPHAGTPLAGHPLLARSVDRWQRPRGDGGAGRLSDGVLARSGGCGVWRDPAAIRGGEAGPFAASRAGSLRRARTGGGGGREGDCFRNRDLRGRRHERLPRDGPPSPDELLPDEGRFFRRGRSGRSVEKEVRPAPPALVADLPARSRRGRRRALVSPLTPQSEMRNAEARYLRLTLN